MTTATVTANGKAGENGTAKPQVLTSPVKVDRDVPVFDYSRLHGMEGMPFLRGYECMQLLHVVRAAFTEAERATVRADRAPTEGAVRDALVEALTCVATGEHYARMLLDQLIAVDAPPDGGDAPLF